MRALRVSGVWGLDPEEQPDEFSNIESSAR